MNYRPIAILVAVIILLGGCEFLKNHKKVVKLEAKRVGIMINDGKWNAVKKKMARGFIWETSDGVKYGRTRKGKEVGRYLFVKSLRDVPKHRNFEFVVEEVGKIDKTTYIARCEARLRINKGIDRFDTLIWQMAQTWKQSEKDKTWRLTKIKDNGPKKGHKGQVYNTNPSRKVSKAPRSGAPRALASGGNRGSNNSVFNYEIGQNQLQTKEQSKTRSERLQQRDLPGADEDGHVSRPLGRGKKRLGAGWVVSSASAAGNDSDKEIKFNDGE